MSVSDSLGPFTDRVYEAAAVPELWPAVLRDFARLADAEEAVLIAARGTEFNRWIVTSPEFEELVVAHSQRFPTNERTRRLIAAQHAGFLRDKDVLSQEEIDREPVYQELLFPRGYGFGVATAIFAPSGDNIILHAECARSHGPVSNETVTTLDRTRPHFARAALLSARLELERARAAAQALDALGLPGAVLQRGGRMLAANPLFTALIPDVMQDRPSRLGLADQAADALLVAGLGKLAGASGGAAVGSIPIAARDDRPPMIVHLLPVRGAAHDVFASAAAIVVVTPVTGGGVPAPEVLQGLFDLTPAEARLAGIVGAGVRPREAATRLGIAEETARTTLKQVLAKTGMRRQAELVGLLRGVAVGPRDAG